MLKIIGLVTNYLSLNNFQRLICQKVQEFIKITKTIGKAVVVEDIKTKATKSINSYYIEVEKECPHNKKGKRPAIL